MDEQAKDNARKAKAIIDLYSDLKSKILELTRSQYAVPGIDVAGIDGLILKCVLPIDPGRDFLYISGERELPYEEYFESK